MFTFLIATQRYIHYFHGVFHYFQDFAVAGTEPILSHVAGGGVSEETSSLFSRVLGDQWELRDQPAHEYCFFIPYKSIRAVDWGDYGV